MKPEDYSGTYNKIAKHFLNSMLSDDKNENIVFSPLSIVMLMAIAAISCDGTAKEEIVNVLGADLTYEELKSVLIELQSVFSNSDSMKSSNAVCVQERIADSIKPDFVERLSEFGGRLFASKDIVRDVNEWVSKNTNGLITEIADESIKNQLACLMNAVAYTADWNKKYEEDDIFDDIFNNADGTLSEASMLFSTERLYIETEEYKGFAKPYKNSKYSFMALLPNKHGTGPLKKMVRNADFTQIYKSGSKEKVYVTMPEFKYGKDLTATMTEMGIRNVFSSEADFSPMSTEQLKIESVFHQVHIEVDRKGTKAAAATMAVLAGGCVMLDDTRIIDLNRPFVYSIVHNETGLPVFIGVMNRAD